MPNRSPVGSQHNVLVWLSLGIMIVVSVWVVAVTLYTRFGLIDARVGLGWSLAAGISSAAELKTALVVTAAIVTAGLSAAGSAQQPRWMTYLTGGIIMLALAASVFLWGLLSDYEYLNEYRGTSPFPNIVTRDQILSAARSFSVTLVLALSSSLAAMLGVRAFEGKRDG